jgi:hypothetical protein
MRLSPPVPLAAVLLALTIIGCAAGPRAANITLRKELQQRDAQIALLTAQHQADLADLRASTRPTTTTLTPDRLARLYTTHGLTLGRLTGGSNLDTAKSGDQGLKIYAVPTDDDGQPLKAAGTFTIEAFDLSLPENNRIGNWQFDLNAARQSWVSGFLLYNYVLICPWQNRVPTNSQVTIRVMFHDELTDREFTQQRLVNVNPPATTAP